jgi:hypothetical protein
MSHLNPNATEWKPTGMNTHGMTDLALPPATAMPDEAGNTAAGSREVSGGTPPGSAAAAGAAAGVSSTPPSYIPSYMTGGDPTIAEELANIDWDAEFKRLMELTGELIERQLNGQDGDDAAAGAAAHSNANTAATNAGGAATPGNASAATPGAAAETAEARLSAVPLPTTYANAVKGAAAAARKPTTLGVASTSSTAAAAAAVLADADDSASMAPTLATTKGATKHHWKKLTKAQQRQEQSQRNAFEAFASALLHSVSPFMAPLRERCKTSLPHIKVDQRFGKSGHPETAIAQFIVAPLVTNYRPRHFHDVAPGELMEFHYDFSLVLQAIPSAYAIHIGYGPTWKRFAVPYCYVACKEYRKEVLALCPEETPNSRSEAIYEDDVVKDITDLLLKRGEGLELLETMSIVEAMRKRVDLAPLYDAFATVFQPLENYQIEMVDIWSAPSRFLIKASRLAVEAMPQPVVLDEDVTWDELPEYARVIVQGGRSASVNNTNDNHNSNPTADGGERSPYHGSVSSSAGTASAKGSATPVLAAAVAAAATAAAGPGKRRAASSGKAAKVAEGNAWQVVAPLALSGLCVLATVAIVVLKKRKH